METKPSYYHQGKLLAHEIEEQIFLNVALGPRVFDPDKSYVVKIEDLIKAKWTSMALKHMMRAGLKDETDVELYKAMNYLHFAINGRWMDE